MIDIKLKYGQDGYDVVGEYIRKYWSHNLTDVVIVSIGISHNGDNYAVFCTCERKWVNKTLKLKESNPDDVEITMYPENNDGYIVAHVPKNWFKLSPPRQMNSELHLLNEWLKLECQKHNSDY